MYVHIKNFYYLLTFNIFKIIFWKYDTVDYIDNDVFWLYKSSLIENYFNQHALTSVDSYRERLNTGIRFAI